MIAEEKRLYLEEGVEFLEKYGLTELIEEFVNFDESRKVMHQVFQEQVEQIKILFELASKERKESLEIFMKIHCLNEKKFVAESIEIFKFRVFENFNNLSPTIMGLMKSNNVFEDLFKGKMFLQDFREIISEIKANNVVAFSKRTKTV